MRKYKRVNRFLNRNTQQNSRKKSKHVKQVLRKRVKKE